MLLCRHLILPSRIMIYSDARRKERYSIASTATDCSVFCDSPAHLDLKWDPRTEFYMCELCGTKHIDMFSFEVHAKGRKHLCNLDWREYEEADRNPSSARMGDSELGIPAEIECRGSLWYRCSLCDCQLGGPDSIRSHCEGKKHRSALKKMNSFHRPPSYSDVTSDAIIRKESNSELMFRKYSDQASQRAESQVCMHPCSDRGSPAISWKDSDYEGVGMSPLSGVVSYKIKGGRVIPPPPNYRPNTVIGHK